MYKRDARQLVRAGLAGGKGIPGTIAAHPCVFATLTAPSFGPVHARRLRGKTVLPCRPRRDASSRRCPHGRDISCPTRHVEGDPRLGQPMCPDCYDYEAAVLFNAYAADLWRRFVTYLPRHLARLAGVTQKTAARSAPYPVRQGGRVPGARRGPLPRRDPPRRGGGGLPAPGRSAIPLALLCDAIDQAAAAVRILIDHDGQALALGFGPQTDTRIIRHGGELPGSGHALNGHAVANYIAKYATKTSGRGLPSMRIRSEADIEQLRCPAHYRAMITAAWQLGSTRHDTRFRAWAHMLGYGGHFLTKSRRYSVTFGQLRTARADHRRATRPPDQDRDAWDRPLDETVVLVLGTIWPYAGIGHTTPGAELAAASAARAREHSDQADPG